LGGGKINIIIIIQKFMAKKIFIIEDEEIISELLEKKLKEEGYEVKSAKDGEEGWKLLQQSVLEKTPPDLILLDIVMPKKNGFEVMQEMQKNQTLCHIPVIIISNSGQSVELTKAQELGAKDWLIKTEFDHREVLSKINRYIGK